MLSNAELDRFVKSVRSAREDILNELILYRSSTGEVREAYKLVVLDKLWKLSRLTGEFNLRMLKETADIQTNMDKDLHTEKVEALDNKDLNEEYNKWREIMESELAEVRSESDSQLREVQISNIPFADS